MFGQAHGFGSNEANLDEVDFPYQYLAREPWDPYPESFRFGNEVAESSTSCKRQHPESVCNVAEVPDHETEYDSDNDYSYLADSNCHMSKADGKRKRK